MSNPQKRLWSTVTPGSGEFVTVTEYPDPIVTIDTTEPEEIITDPSALIAVEALKAEGYEILSVEQAHGSTMLQDFTPLPGKKYAVVFGNEVKGVHQEVVDASDGCLEIPQFGTKHSLNVSVTAGIVIWHFATKMLLNA